MWDESVALEDKAMNCHMLTKRAVDDYVDELTLWSDNCLRSYTMSGLIKKKSRGTRSYQVH